MDSAGASKDSEPEPDVDFFLAMSVRWDVRWLPIHWVNFKSDSVKRRDRDALELIEQVERRFWPYAVDRGGPPKADPVPHDLQEAIRAEWPGARLAVTPILKDFRASRISRAERQLKALCDELELRPSDIAKLISKWIRQKAALRGEPRQLAYELLAKKHRCSARVIKTLSASAER